MSTSSRTFPVHLVLFALLLAGGIWTFGSMQATRSNVASAANDAPNEALIAVGESAGQPVAFPLQHISPDDARRMLMDLLGPMADTTQVTADDEGRRLLVQGGTQSLQLTRKLLAQVDQSEEPTASTALRNIEQRQQPLPDPSRIQQVGTPAALKTPAAESVQGYYCLHRPAEDIANAIRGKFGSAVTVKTSDTRMLVIANPQLQPVIDKFRQAIDQPTAQIRANPVQLTDGRQSPNPSVVNAVATQNKTAPVPTKNRQLATVAVPDNSPGSVTVTFRNRSVEQTIGILNQLLKDRLKKYSDKSVAFTAKDGRIVNLQFSDSQCRIAGPTVLVNQFATLLNQLDSRSEETKTRFIRIQKADRAALQKALDRLREGKRSKAPAGVKPVSKKPSNSQSSVADKSLIQQAAFQQSNQPADGSEDALRRPASDIRIEALPDLDVIILQGRDGDVDELTKIIQEIERISEETTPEIEVYKLQHTRDDKVDELISQVVDDLIGPLQGRVSITPLVKPNALLLIGWGEAVEAVKKLIEKVDVPVDAPTQLQVFSLKNSAATDVRETIIQFFEDRGGLSPSAIISADQRTNAIIVNASPRDLQEVELLIEKLDTGTTQAVNQARILKLKNSLAADISQTVEAAIAAARGGDGNGRSAVLEMLLQTPDGAKLVKSGLLGDVRVVPDPRTNTLFLTGPEESIALVEQLVNSLDDEPASAAQLKVFEVRHGSAGELVTVLRTLFPQAPGAAGQIATAAGETSLAPVRFSVDARTNSIIVTGSTGDLRIVEALLIRLDQDGSQRRMNRVYRLRNSPADVVATAVNEFLRSERVVRQAAPGTDNPFQQIEQEVVVVPEPIGNSLLISATSRFFEDILELVEELDKQPPQVLIQVILAEVDLNNFHEFGVELGLQDSLLFDRSLLGDLLTTTQTIQSTGAGGAVTNVTNDVIQAATNTPGFNFNNNLLGNSGSNQALSNSGDIAGQALSHFSLGRTNSELGYGGLVLSASSENISVLIRALNQSRRVDILSRPQIMTLDNQPAFIQVGERVPRVTGSQINTFGQTNTFELEDVGLILGVTPRISPDGTVVMEVDAEKSEIGSEAEGIPISFAGDQVVRSPRVNIAMAQTTVSAASGQTVIIGGLITKRSESITRRVPWLADIPILGEVFKYDGSDERRSELLIILTPHVIRNRQDAEHMKQLEMSRMSWCSQDVFEWLTPETQLSKGMAIDESGVQVIYPDEDPSAPGMNHPLQHVPESTPQTPSIHTAPQDGVVWPLEPMSKTGDQNRSVQQTGFERSRTGETTTNEKPGRINWPFGRKTGATR